MKTILAINKKAAAAIPRGSICVFVTDDDTVTFAASATAMSIGVLNQAKAAATDDRVDVQIEGIANVLAGGTVARGDLLTSDANGAAITTVTATNRVIGMALKSAVAGDLFDVHLRQHII